jgi:hypothetical protein
MKLRDRIAQVRGEIEALQARQQSFSRLVSLATIHVTIQQLPKQDSPPPAAKTSLLNDTLTGLSDAAENGLRTLSRSVAGLVQIAIGGLLLWVPIATFIVVWISMIRKHLRNVWREPAPSLRP